MPNIPDFETLFSQVQLFISTCNGEHIRYATDTCKSCRTKPANGDLSFRCLWPCILILNILLSPHSCWSLPPVDKRPRRAETGNFLTNTCQDNLAEEWLMIKWRDVYFLNSLRQNIPISFLVFSHCKWSTFKTLLYLFVLVGDSQRLLMKTEHFELSWEYRTKTGFIYLF